MSKHYFFGLAGLLLGLVIGFVGANSINRSAATAESTSAQQPKSIQSAPDPAPRAPMGMQPDVANSLSTAEREPQSFAAQMKAGDVYARIGRFDKAVEFYRRGLALNPADVRANLVLANALFDSRQFEEAAEYYSKALEFNPTDNNARTDLGTTFVERQDADFERAINEFDKVLQSDPKHEAALFNMSMAYFRKGDAENARKSLEKLEQANPSSELIGRLRQNISQK